MLGTTTCSPGVGEGGLVLGVLGVLGVLTKLVQIGLHPQVESPKSSKQAASPAKADKNENRPGGLFMAWTPQQVYCDCVNINFTLFWTVQRPETH